ncbi:MAG: hypothetical protein H6901_05030 [Rhodobacteraceae bacterium]|nr:hypothetical protein [Paracoccaceae bacterium]MCP5341564.1 hypothetical protein [Paracoccaceae bacterium]
MSCLGGRSRLAGGILEKPPFRHQRRLFTIFSAHACLNLLPAFVGETLQGRAGNVEMRSITIRFSFCPTIQHCLKKVQMKCLFSVSRPAGMPSAIELLRRSA